MNESQTIMQLEVQIRTQIQKIKNKEVDAKSSGIGKLFSKLVRLDRASHGQLLLEYKPISQALQEADRNTRESKQSRAKRIDRELSRIVFDDEYSDIDDVPQKIAKAPVKIEKENPVRQARIIPAVEHENFSDKNKDRTMYTYKNTQYGKGPLVLTIVREHVNSNPSITFNDLKRVFPDDIFRGYGVFTDLERAKMVSLSRKRYFLNNNQLLKVQGTVIAVCNQVDSKNILKFLAAVKKLGYKVD